MTIRWLREAHQYDGNMEVTLRWNLKAMALFLKYCCGWTFVSHVVSSGSPNGDYQSYEKSGTAGSFDGSSFVLSDASNSFTYSDAGKVVVIHDPDPSKARNDGIYRIGSRLSASQIEIDFRSDYNEFPTASSNLRWYILAVTYQLPAYNQVAMDNYVYWIMRSPHASGWELQAGDYNAGFSDHNWNWIAAAPTGDWNRALSGAAFCSYDYCGTAPFDRQTWLYVAVDDDWIFPFVYYGLNNNNIGQFQGAKASRIIPIQPGHSDQELFALQGCASNAYAIPITRSIGGAYYGRTMCHTRMWSDRRNAEYIGLMVAPSIGWSSNAFLGYTGKEFNYRTQRLEKYRMGQGEVMNNDYPVIMDADNATDNYQMMGYLKGTRGVNTRNGLIRPGQLLSSDGVKRDRFHIQAGFVIDWPEVTPRFGE